MESKTDARLAKAMGEIEEIRINHEAVLLIFAHGEELLEECATAAEVVDILKSLLGGGRSRERIPKTKKPLTGERLSAYGGDADYQVRVKFGGLGQNAQSGLSRCIDPSLVVVEMKGTSSKKTPCQCKPETKP